jgi:hypothetical protein
MDQLNATRGLCLFQRDTIESDHRYSAAQQDVLLLTQGEFATYAAATGSKPDSSRACSAEIERWEMYFEVAKKFPALAPTISFCTSGYWMCRGESEACRKIVAEAIRVKSELDPNRPEHAAVMFDLAALFSHSLTRVVNRIFASYLQPKNRDILSDALLTFLYGGRENYELMNSMRKLIATASAATDKPLTLPEWDRFLQLIRSGLDSPTEIAFVPLLLREVGWSFLGKQQLEFAAVLATENRQAAKLSLLAAKYIIKAWKYPPEFATLATELLLSLQPTPGQTAP